MLATTELIKEAGQLSRLQQLFPRWRRVPLYRARLPEKNNFVQDRLSRFPFITKHEMLEDFPRNFLPPDANLESLLERKAVELEYTSGTSEERTPVLLRCGWWAEQEERALRLNPFVAQMLNKNPSARRATLTTPACNGRTCPVVWQSVAQRTIGLTRFVNLARIPFILNHSELNRMAEEIADWSPQFLDLDPVHGVWLALHCERQRIQFPTLKFVLCSYEFVSIVHRRILQRAFGVPVFNLYGSTETGHLFMEDEGGEMKPSYENAFLEVIEPDTRGIGDLVVTTLTNDFMPLLRYRIGDLVEQRERPYRTRYVVHGRSRDALRDSDGRRVTTLEVDQCFEGIDGVAHYELRQDDNGECRLRFVPHGNGLERESSEVLGARLESLLKLSGKIAVEAVNLLPPASSGKFRLTYRE